MTQFSTKSNATIEKAAFLTKQCSFPLVEPQVMMAAMLQEGNQMVTFLLNQMGIERDCFFSKVGETIRSLTRTQEQLQDPPKSEKLKRILEKAGTLSESDGKSIIALEYIFWAFIEIDNPVRDIMIQFGINSQKIKSAICTFQNGLEEQSNQIDANEENYPNLYKYGRNLIKLAENNEIDPVIGRDEEIRRILQIISRKTKNNPILVGEPGIGKTAIVEGLALRIVRGDVPEELKDIQIFNLDIPSLVAGAQAQGEFEQRLKDVMQEAGSDPNILLFIDEIHLLIGAGRSCGAMDAANILKPELARGAIKLVGATTLDEYRKYIEQDKAFERRLQKIVVNEPDVESTITIMRGIKSGFENHYHIKILDEAIVAAVNLSHRFITNRCLPDKAIDLLDEAASSMKIDITSVPHDLEMLRGQIVNKEIEKESLLHDEVENEEIHDLEIEIMNLREQENDLNAKWQNERTQLDAVQNLRTELSTLNAQKDSAERHQNYTKVAELNRNITSKKNQMETLISDFENDSTLLKIALDENDIMNVVTKWTSIPMTNMTQDENDKLLHIEETLHNSVIGQSEAVKSVANAVRRNRMGFANTQKPIGTFLFLGTTGVGKTELCKALAGYLFDSRDMLVRIDMSEYQQEYSVSRLFGAPPGYVGYEEGGQLTEAVRRKPYSVVLFDEIEKAHPRVFETLLQVLDDGRMTDGQGHVVDFKNTIIIMTSNIGQDIISENLVDHNQTEELVEEVKKSVISQLKAFVAPEFINRIDEIVMFLPLTIDDVKQIVNLQLSNLLKTTFESEALQVSFDATAIDFLSRKGYDANYGARPVKRVIQKYILDKMSLLLLHKTIDRNSPIVVSAFNDELIIANN